MEELQDAIEDAQYVNAISNVDDGPRPVLPWEIPTEEQLAEWRDAVTAKKRREGDPEPFGFDWTLQQPLGFFLFSAYLKETCRDYVQINFVEEVLRFKQARGGARRDSVRRIVKNYLLPLADKGGGGGTAAPEATSEACAAAAAAASEQSPASGEAAGAGGEGGVSAAPTPPLPEKTEIDEYDLDRPPPKEEIVTKEEMEASTDSTCARCCVGLTGPILDQILENATVPVEKSAAAAPVAATATPAKAPASTSNAENDSANAENVAAAAATSNGPASAPSAVDPTIKRRISETKIQRLPDNFFDKAEAVVLASIRAKYWDSFDGSEEHAKLMNFLWFQDRKVVEEDFFVMRVLGRGGFGLVNACKKGTSGKLYAMKVMNKKRIKIKKSEQLILNERRALSKVDSPFVVNLKYCFHSKDDVFLVLDLMTGGDLSFHLQQRGRFPKKEAMYYAARIMLGLQALHDHNYVYRDLKPENCLLAEDGRVKLTDLGLATEVYPKLHGAAGTRGYWAPEMLRRDKKGKRMPYGTSVDWFSFGCCVAEFISGTNPFRSEMALNFGLERGKKKKEEAIDCATLEMDPVFESKKFDEDAADLCRKLLDKDEKKRLGVQGCKDIMDHPWFKDLNWESIITDRKKPPYVPPKDVNAASQSEIGTFAEDKTFQETVLEDKDEDHYKDWDWTNPRAFAAEVIEFLIYERETGQPLLPMTGGGSCCCAIQ
jgi:beta-adrenergic-receptor kinase